MNKKFIIFGLMTVFAMAFAVALLVPYISNIIEGDIEVKSPITLTVEGGNNYSLQLYASESISMNSTTEIHIAELTGHLGEVKISDFDGEGISINYEIPGLDNWNISGCTVEENGQNNTYYYIGNPSDVLPMGTIDSITTFSTAIDLQPGFYDIQSSVILAENAACI